MELGVITELIKNLLKSPMTVRFPHEAIPIPEGYRGEWVLEPDKCEGCGLCANVCQVRAIKMVQVPERQREDEPNFYSGLNFYPQMDIGKCCFCRMCEEACPQGAIKLTENFFLSTFDSSTLIREPTEH